MELNKLKEEGKAPEWMTEESLTTLQGGYLLDGETPYDMYARLASSASKRLGKPELEKKFFDYMWNNWLCPATPVASNLGTSRGCPISCFSFHVGDSVHKILDSMHEAAMMSKNGGGLGSYWGDVRSRGSAISQNGTSSGIVHFLKIYESTILGISQGGTRRGAGAAYLPVEHGDIEEFLKIRKPTGDENRQCLNLNQGVVINDNFMKKVLGGDLDSRELWKEILKTRIQTGQPFLMFADTANRQSPLCYQDKGLTVSTSNLCSEILLYTDENHSFVCCLSSLNLARYYEWKDTDLVKVAIYFLDGVMQEFIQKARDIHGMEKAVRFAEKSRALGLGVLGWHSLLQSCNLPFKSLGSELLNEEIFKHMDQQSLEASQELAKELGEPEWTKGYGVRNSHRLALAPTVSNSIISGNVSPTIEPIAANVFVNNTAKGSFKQKNLYLEKLLEEKGKNTSDVWKSISDNYGSVQHLDFLNDSEKEIFLTAYEMSQQAIIDQAASRQTFIDQGQSINLFFPADPDMPPYINQIHINAWRQGLKTLYYLRTHSVLSGDKPSREYYRYDIDKSSSESDCSFCES